MDSWSCCVPLRNCTSESTHTHTHTRLCLVACSACLCLRVTSGPAALGCEAQTTFGLAGRCCLVEAAVQPLQAPCWFMPYCSMYQLTQCVTQLNVYHRTLLNVTGPLLLALLCRSASEGAEARDVKYAADGTAVPSSPSALGTAQAHPADTNLETAALAAVAADHMAGAQSPVSIAPAASAQGAQAAAASGSHSHSHSHNHSVAAVAGAAAAADTSAEESDAAAVLAAVAEAAGEAPSSAHSPSGGEAAALAALQHFPGFALADGATAAGGVPYSGVQPPQQQYGYAPCGFYPPAAYLYPPAPGLPPLPKQQRKGGTGSAATFAEADMVAAAAVAEMAAAGSSGSVDLMVRGSNRPFAALAAAAHGGGASAAAAVAAAMEAEGQEQVNILNLPLPEVELQVC